jgi:hypothetical protein
MSEEKSLKDSPSNPSQSPTPSPEEGHEELLPHAVTQQLEGTHDSASLIRVLTPKEAQEKNLKDRLDGLLSSNDVSHQRQALETILSLGDEWIIRYLEGWTYDSKSGEFSCKGESTLNLWGALYLASRTSVGDGEFQMEKLHLRVQIPEELLLICEVLSVNKRIKKLNITCEEISDLSPLSQLTSLENLKIRSRNSSVTDLSPLAQLTKLEDLGLIGMESVTNLSPLVALNQLSNLFLNGASSLTDLSPLAQLTKLEDLGLIGMESVTDLSPLVALVQLKRFFLSGARNLTDMGPLSDMPSLRELKLIGLRKLKDFSPLSQMPALEDLDLVACDNLKNLDGIKGNSGLHTLVVQDCHNLQEINAVSGLSALRELTLEYCNRFKGWEGLVLPESLEVLRVFIMSTDSDLACLKGHTGLQVLYLSKVKGLSSMETISTLPNLRKLTVEDCKGITDISPIAALSEDSLKEVKIGENNCPDLIR